MPIIKYTNKASLREHPFGDPISQPTPVQTHSYVYPGDELVLQHKLGLPNDAGVLDMSNLKFISAKLSLIAQKPNILTEEFVNIFAATRNFELDSFTTTFNNVNAKVVPWGLDGYAPNMNLQQDRNWKLPAGDFRRQINLFTKYDATANPKWDYWFLFPVLFRWEYWKAMAQADNDFYNIAQSQNGQNQFWQHYFVPGALPFGWRIKSRLELTVLVNGVSTIIRSELNLTPNSDDIDNYNSNTDWTTKSIKTAKVAGTPSNSPCFIYGNQYTEVWAYLTKVSNWATSEQGNISTVVWIEPFEGSGITARTRASSLYPVGSESVFVGLNTSITDDSGLGIQTDSGLYVVTDNSGAGAIVLFDGLAPLTVKIFALIDPNKLNTVYPGITKFTTYCRLYNKTFITGTITKRGEEIKQDCLFVSPPSTDASCNPLAPFCPFNLDVFAESGGVPNPLNNDKSDFYQYGDASVVSIALTLQKNDSTCDTGNWADKVTIVDDSFGKFFAYGLNPDFSGASFTDDYNKQYTGLMLEWSKVLTAHGSGYYRMKIVKTDAFTATTTTYDNRIFFLRPFNCALADNSVRLQFKTVGERGTLEDNTIQIDYAKGWNSEIRLRGLFYADKKPAYVNEFMQYGSASFNALKPYVAELKPKYILELKSLPGWMDRYLENNFLLADEMLITDYNTVNINLFNRFPVINDGGIETMRETLAPTERLAGAILHLAYGQNNLRKRNSQ